MSDSGCIFFLVMVLFLLINLQSCRISKLERDLAVVVELKDTSDLDSDIHRGCAGLSPVNGIKDGGIMEKVLKRYENKSTGQVIVAYKGLSRPDHEYEPFYEGYWIKTDPYGSEQFMKKADFEQEYRLIKTPTK